MVVVVSVCVDFRARISVVEGGSPARCGGFLWLAGGRLSRHREKAALAAAMEHAAIKSAKDQMEYEVARDHQKGLDNTSELWGVMDEYCRVLTEQMDKTREEQDELKQMQRRLNAWVTDEGALREVRLDLLNEQDFRRLTLALITEVVATSAEDQTIELDAVGRW